VLIASSEIGIGDSARTFSDFPKFASYRSRGAIRRARDNERSNLCVVGGDFHDTWIAR